MKRNPQITLGCLVAGAAAVAAIGAGSLVAKDAGQGPFYSTAYYLFSNDTVTYSDSVGAILDTDSSQTFTPGTSANNCGMKYNGSTWVTDSNFSSTATLVMTDVINPSENTDEIPNSVYVVTSGSIPSIGTTMSSFALQTDANNNGTCFEVFNATTYNFLKYQVSQ